MDLRNCFTCLMLGVASATATSQVVFSEDFDTGGLAWVSTFGEWQVGVPTAGPLTAHDGSPWSAGNLCAATILSANHHPSNDSRFESQQFLMPPVDKAAGRECWLEFRSWFSYSSCDSGRAAIGIYDTSTLQWDWLDVGTTAESTSPWSYQGVDITPFVSANQQLLMKVGFSHNAHDVGSACSGTSYGWAVDDVRVIVRTPAFSGGFESGWSGWSTDRGVWQIGTPDAGSVPGAAFSGSGLASTVLDGIHPGHTDSRLISPTVQLPAVVGEERLHLRFRSHASYSSCDSGVVQVRTFDSGTGTWSSWTSVGAAAIEASSWWVKAVDLTPYAGQTARVSFFHSANATGSACAGTSWGWAVDDVALAIYEPALRGHFEFGWEDLYSDRGVWEIGEPSSGPGAVLSGAGLAATVLGGSHPGSTDSSLYLGETTLPTATGFEQVYLRLDHWFSYSSCDSGRVQISVYDPLLESWSGFTTLATYGGTSASAWIEGSLVPLTSYAGKTVRIRLFHEASATGSACAGTSLGWYVDNLSILSGFPGFWGDYGLATGGTSGDPLLSGSGELTGGGHTEVQLTNALPGSIMALVAGTSQGMQPLKGGILVPDDQVIAWPLLVDGSGAVTCSGSWPLGVPPGTEVIYQAWIVDPGADQGYAASNALYALTQ